MVVTDLNWVDVAPPRRPGSFDVEARIRHGQPPSRATLRVAEPGEGTPARAVVEFGEPVFAPAPGQALVAYRGDAVLCGGTIVETA